MWSRKVDQADFIHAMDTYFVANLINLLAFVSLCVSDAAACSEIGEKIDHFHVTVGYCIFRVN